MELCGTYALVPESMRGFTTRDYQLTTVEEAQKFLRHAPGSRKSRRLAPLLRLMQNGARSPMETREYLLACLPRRYGGYGLPKAQLNHRIELLPEERRVSKRGYFECDMCWPDHKVVIEYDGHADHESRDDRARDASKRNVLLARGYRVFTVTGEQICDAASFDSIMRDVATCLHYRMRDFPIDWTKRREELRMGLFKSMSAYEAERFGF